MADKNNKLICEDEKVATYDYEEILDDGIFVFESVKHCPVIQLKTHEVNVRFKSGGPLMIDDYI